MLSLFRWERSAAGQYKGELQPTIYSAGTLFTHNVLLQVVSTTLVSRQIILFAQLELQAWQRERHHRTKVR